MRRTTSTQPTKVSSADVTNAVDKGAVKTPWYAITPTTDGSAQRQRRRTAAKLMATQYRPDRRLQRMRLFAGDGTTNLAMNAASSNSYSFRRT